MGKVCIVVKLWYYMNLKLNLDFSSTSGIYKLGIYKLGIFINRDL